jgi:hypothetical protein
MVRYMFTLVKMGLYMLVVEERVNEWRVTGPTTHYLLIYSIPTCVMIDIWEGIKKLIIFSVDFINVFFVFYAQMGALAIVL